MTPTLDDVRAAAVRIAPYANRTPVMTSATLDEMSGRALFFKCELFQKVGAFKFRGACNAVMKLPDDVAARGVVTHSSGNHAQALALAAKLRGIPAHIVMPTNAPPVKRRAVEGYGAIVHPCDPTQAAREQGAARVVAETGGTLIAPYDHPDVIAGQGTIALELLEQVPDLDAVIVPVGGGGMISGIAIAMHGAASAVRVIGAEPAGADDAARSKASGQWQPQTNPETVADGLRTSLGELTWPVVRDLVERIVTVDEPAIVAAMRLVWERMKLVIEPSAAVGVAVALSDAFRALGGLERVAVVLCGGNVDLDQWAGLRRDSDDHDRVVVIAVQTALRLRDLAVAHEAGDGRAREHLADRRDLLRVAVAERQVAAHAAEHEHARSRHAGELRGGVARGVAGGGDHLLRHFREPRTPSNPPAPHRHS